MPCFCDEIGCPECGPGHFFGKVAQRTESYDNAPLRGVALEIAETCDEIKQFIIDKNTQYGNSALDPVRIFSKADAQEQIRVRLDDKISRLVRGDDSLESDMDIIDDMIGYLVLYKLIQKRKENDG